MTGFFLVDKWLLPNKKFQVAYEETPIIEALHSFVNKRVSALPIVDKEVCLLTAKQIISVKNSFTSGTVGGYLCEVWCYQLGGREDLFQPWHYPEGGEQTQEWVVWGGAQVPPGRVAIRRNGEDREGRGPSSCCGQWWKQGGRSHLPFWYPQLPCFEAWRWGLNLFHSQSVSVCVSKLCWHLIPIIFGPFLWQISSQSG